MDRLGAASRAGPPGPEGGGGDAAARDAGILDKWALVITPTELFRDGFELGDYCQWSGVVGAPPCGDLA